VNDGTDGNGNASEYWARQYYRSLIQPMPGSGAAVAAIIRPRAGTALGYEVIGIRGTSLAYSTGTGGWTTSGVNYNKALFFNTGGGTTEAALPVAGQTVVDGTSGATGVVSSIQLWGGSVANNDAYGVMYFSSTTGTWSSSSSTIKLSGTVVATNWNGGTITPSISSAGCVCRFVNWNFYGSANTWSTYFVLDNENNGSGNAYELDYNYNLKQIYLPVQSGTVPTAWFRFVEVHLNYLMLGTAGGNFYQSVEGTPLNFSGFFSAEQFGVGSEITGMFSATGPALIITTQYNTQAMTGTDPTTWAIGLIGERMGAELDTGQKLDAVYGMGAIGVTKFARTLTFGNFAGGVISQQVQPLIVQYVNDTNCSRIVRASNQYRVYFDDGTFMIMFIPVAGQSNMPGVSAAQASNAVAFGLGAYPVAPVSMFTDVDWYGNEQCFWVDGTTGYAFHDTVGNSFDGANIVSYLRLAYNFLESPGYTKFFRRADFDFETAAFFNMSYLMTLDYSTQAESNLFDAYIDDPAAAPTFYAFPNADQVTWEADLPGPTFTYLQWDSQNIGVARAELQGTGEGATFLLYNKGATVYPYILQGYTLYSELRRLQR